MRYTTTKFSIFSFFVELHANTKLIININTINTIYTFLTTGIASNEHSHRIYSEKLSDFIQFDTSVEKKSM